MAKLSTVYSSRGAPMGRTSVPRTPTERVHLRRIRINSGGYDSGGAYWGVGQALLHACEYKPDGLDIFFRAKDRTAAKAHVLARYLSAKFYR